MMRRSGGTIYRFDSNKMIFIAASDAGGVDSLPVSEEHGVVSDTTQGAWIIMASDTMPSASSSCKVSILSWRSAKLRRRVSSTLAGEALACSQSLSELEWLQIMYRDILHGDVIRPDWQKSLLPFVAVLRQDCELQGRLDQCSVTDAKSLYDTVRKNNPTSRQDRRTSVELAIIIEALQASRGVLRWSPHPRMVADALTKDDIAKSNGALEQLMRTGHLRLWSEDLELERRKDPMFRGRSKSASHKIREAEEAALLALPDQLHVNKDLVELSKVSTSFLSGELT